MITAEAVLEETCKHYKFKGFDEHPNIRRVVEKAMDTYAKLQAEKISSNPSVLGSSFLRDREQIKVNGIYYLVSIEERDALRQMEANLYGSCTPEGIAEFQKELRRIVRKSPKQFIQSEDDVYEMSTGLPPEKQK